MSLDYILLGMLDEPASGYDLGRAFEQSARMFWSAELSQIYPALKKLEKGGYLTSSEAPSVRGPKRRVYERTAEGEAQLHDWLRERPEIGSARLPYVAKLFFLGQLEDPEASVAFVQALKIELTARLARFKAIEECHLAEDPVLEEMTDVAFHEYTTLRAGMHVAEARLAWCEETLRRLERRIEARREAAPAPSDDGSAHPPAAISTSGSE